MSRPRHVRPSSPALPRHRRRADLSTVLRRGTIGAGIVAVAALLGLGGTAALWSSSTSLAPGSVTSGSLSTAQSSVSPASYQGTAGRGYREFLAVPVTNTGSTDAAVTISATTTASTGTLVSAVDVFVWSTNASTACSASTAQGSAGKWTSLPAFSATLAAGATGYYCLRTELPSGSSATGDYSASLTFTLKKGGWTASTSAAVTQSVRAAATSTTTMGCTQGWDATVTWQQPSSRTGYHADYTLRVNGKAAVPVNTSYTSVYIEAGRFDGLARNAFYTVDVIIDGQTTPFTSRTLYFNAEGRVRCDGPPIAAAPGSTAAKAACTDNGGSNVNLTWTNPSGAGRDWAYEARIGTSVLGAAGDYYSTSYWLDQSTMAAFAKNQQHRIDIVRKGTATVLFTAVVTKIDNGNLWCA